MEEDIDHSHVQGDDDSDDAIKLILVELYLPQESHIPLSSASLARENPQRGIHADTRPGERRNWRPVFLLFSIV